MTDITKAPQRIWAFEDEPGGVPRSGIWIDEKSECPEGSPEYTRVDLAESAEIRNEALEEAVQIAFYVSREGIFNRIGYTAGSDHIYQAGALQVYHEIIALKSCAPKPAENDTQSDLSVSETSQQAEWQPIETAPKDGTYVLVFEDGAMFACSWEDDIGHDTDAGWSADGEYYAFPTHWMPLPAPPAGKVGA